MKAQHVMGVVAAGFVADALWRRRRAARLPSLPPSTEPLADTHLFVRVAGVELDEATRRAAVAYARGEGLEVLDLVPQRLDALRAMELVRRLDPASYRTARPALGEGGGHALVVSADVARRAGATRFSGLSAAELDELTARLKRYAPTATDVVVTPAIEPVDRTDEDRRAILRRRWLNDLPTYLGGNIIGLGAFAAGAAFGRRWGVAAMAAACAQPYLATLGTPLRPHDRHRFALSRLVAAPYRWLSMAAAADEPGPDLPRLNFYYKEFYDGNGGGEVERGFRLGAPHYRDRAKMPRGHAAPNAWLDVGGGHGHFCNAARDVWPQTRFDALDMSRSVEEAARQGWIDRGHLGFFPQLADELAGSYDVVSMHHYLEHTVDPYAELDAAAKVLPPGGTGGTSGSLLARKGP